MTLRTPANTPSKEWAALRLWAAAARDDGTNSEDRRGNAVALISVLDASHDVRRQSASLADGLWGSALKMAELMAADDWRTNPPAARRPALSKNETKIALDRVLTNVRRRVR